MTDKFDFEPAVDCRIVDKRPVKLIYKLVGRNSAINRKFVERVFGCLEVALKDNPQKFADFVGFCRRSYLVNHVLGDIGVDYGCALKGIDGFSHVALRDVDNGVHRGFAYVKPLVLCDSLKFFGYCLPVQRLEAVDCAAALNRVDNLG